MEENYGLIRNDNNSENNRYNNISDSKNLNDLNKVKIQGIAMFIVESEDKKISLLDELYYKNEVPEKFLKNIHISESILLIRQKLIWLTFLEIFSAIFGFSYYFLRRSMIYIVANTIALILALIGIFSVVKVNELGLLFYTLLTTSLPGTFFLYQIMELFLVKSHSDHNSLNDNYLLLIFSLPYIYDFIVGVYCFIFIYRVSKFNDSLKKIRIAQEQENLEKLKGEIKNIKINFNEKTVKEVSRKRENIK